jgi:hypothetical protein
MESYPIVPATSRALWITLAIVVPVIFGAAGLLVASARGATTSRFELSDQGLRLRGDLWGRFIPAGELRGAAARIVDLDVERALAPRTRTMGTAMPGYRAGWFRLRDGEKALLYLTDERRAVYIPTTRGHVVLLSPQAPERFVARLRQIAPRG